MLLVKIGNFLISEAVLHSQYIPTKYRGMMVMSEVCLALGMGISKS